MKRELTTRERVLLILLISILGLCAVFRYSDFDYKYTNESQEQHNQSYYWYLWGW